MSKRVSFRRRSGSGVRYGGSTRSRGGLVAVAVGAVGFLLAVVTLVSVAALIGSGDGLTAGALVVPMGRIVLVVAVGYLIALALLVLAARSGSPVQAWVCALLAVVIAFVVSIYPLVATASAAVDQARDIVPWILDLIRR
jgi:hypothetical protein